MRLLPAIALATAGALLISCAPLGSKPRVIGSVTIGADLPLSGDDAPDGLPIENAIRLAITQAGRVCGLASHTDSCVTLSTIFDDDVTKGIHDPATGAANIGSLAADARIVGVIGPLYDSVARREIPAANAAGLALISPSNTDECLTQEPADGHCHGEAARLRPHGSNTYFRLVTTQLVEGAAAADLAANQLKRRHAFIVEEPGPLGQALAAEFRSRLQHDGGSVVSAADLAGAATAGADVVYVAGTDVTAAAAVRRQMASAMPGAPLIGSDRLASTQFALAAGVAVRGSYYTVPGPYPPASRKAASFLRDYQRATGTPPTASALAAFDVTNLLLQAVARAIDDSGGRVPSRTQVLHEVAATKDFQGLMGTISLDAHGDTTLKLISTYQWIAPTDRTGGFVAQYAIS